MRHDAHELRLHALALTQLLVLSLELALTLLQRTRHRVERLGQLVELGRPLLRESRREVACSHAARACGDKAHGPDDSAGEKHPVEEEQGRGHDERRDSDAYRTR